MKIIEYKVDDYNFKRAMQENINENIQPLLIAKKFIKYANNKYVREMDHLLQIIEFQIKKDTLKVFAIYIPIYLPWDGLLDYGIEITGSSGVNLLNGKFFTTIYEENKTDLVVQWQHYKDEHIPKLNKLISSIKEGVLPEMDAINSLERFINHLQGMNVLFFGDKFDERQRNSITYEYTIAVYKCLIGQFEQGIKELTSLKEFLDKTSLSGPMAEIQRYIKEILLSLKGESPNDFLYNFNKLCNERRRKYKLLKK